LEQASISEPFDNQDSLDIDFSSLSLEEDSHAVDAQEPPYLIENFSTLSHDDGSGEADPSSMDDMALSFEFAEEAEVSTDSQASVIKELYDLDVEMAESDDLLTHETLLFQDEDPKSK